MSAFMLLLCFVVAVVVRFCFLRSGHACLLRDTGYLNFIY